MCHNKKAEIKRQVASINEKPVVKSMSNLTASPFSTMFTENAPNTAEHEDKQ